MIKPSLDVEACSQAGRQVSTAFICALGASSSGDRQGHNASLLKHKACSQTEQYCPRAAHCCCSSCLQDRTRSLTMRPAAKWEHRLVLPLICSLMQPASLMRGKAKVGPFSRA